MKIAFRADASLQIGTGHVMRCLTLADALHSQGAQCHFVCRQHPGHLLDLIHQRGHTATALPVRQTNEAPATKTPAHAHWLGADWQADAEATCQAIGPEPVHWLVVDHYALDARWEKTLRPHCERLMVIDDLADRPHDCDLLLDQNLGRTETDYLDLTPSLTKRLIGPTYALLRPEFAALRPYSLARRKTPTLQRLLITMGGVDKDNATGQVLEALRACPLPHELHITVVMGPHAPWLQQVQLHATRMTCPTQVLVGVHDMAQLMADSDLAIGAAGSTSWERCCLGLPCIQTVLAENQMGIANALMFTKAVVAVNVDSLKEVLPPIFAECSATLALKALSESACAITNGLGGQRVATQMFGGAL